MITARELDVTKLPPPAQVWVNLALKYTHGYGVVAVPVNEIDPQGNPVLWAHDIPIQAKGDLAVTHGEIYYGLQTNDRVYVHTTEKEFDFPRGDANAETTYGGRGGIRLSNLWRRLVVARQFDGLRLFLSDYFTPAEPRPDPPQRGRARAAAGAFPHLRPRPLHRRRRRSLRLHPRRLHQLGELSLQRGLRRARSTPSTAAITCAIQ